MVPAREFKQVFRSVTEACAKFGSVGRNEFSRAKRRVELSSNPSFYVVEDQLGDFRRIVVEPLLSAVSAAWIEALASALSQYRGWDVLLNLGENVSILVSTSEVLFHGDLHAVHELVGAVEAARQIATDKAEKRRSAKSARLAEVQGRLAEAWPRGQDQPVVFVAAFETRSDSTGGDSVWLLHRGDRYAMDLDEYEFEPEALRLSVYWAKRDGDLLPYEGGATEGLDDAALLAEWMLVENGRPLYRVSGIRIRREGENWEFRLR